MCLTSRPALACAGSLGPAAIVRGPPLAAGAELLPRLPGAHWCRCGLKTQHVDWAEGGQEEARGQASVPRVNDRRDTGLFSWKPCCSGNFPGPGCLPAASAPLLSITGEGAGPGALGARHCTQPSRPVRDGVSRRGALSPRPAAAMGPTLRLGVCPALVHHQSRARGDTTCHTRNEVTVLLLQTSQNASGLQDGG